MHVRMNAGREVWVHTLMGVVGLTSSPFDALTASLFSVMVMLCPMTAAP